MAHNTSGGSRGRGLEFYAHGFVPTTASVTVGRASVSAQILIVG